MEIKYLHIEALSIELDIPFSKGEHSYDYMIEKKTDHSFEVQILKDGQYIFVSVMHANTRYSIEHIEFYMGESETERLEVLTEILEKLKYSDSRIVEKQHKSETKIQAELFDNNQWVIYGYPASTKKIKTGT